MEFSTFDNNNVSPRVCTTKDEATGGNWFSDTGFFCSSQSITASYKGTDAFPYKGGSIFFWKWKNPLETIQLMIRPVAES